MGKETGSFISKADSRDLRLVTPAPRRISRTKKIVTEATIAAFGVGIVGGAGWAISKEAGKDPSCERTGLTVTLTQGEALWTALSAEVKGDPRPMVDCTVLDNPSLNGNPANAQQGTPYSVFRSK